MKFITALLFAMPLISFAQTFSQREMLEERLLLSLKSARQAVLENVQAMPERDLRRTEKLLEKVRLAALGIDSDEPNYPMPTMVCAREGVDRYQQTFLKIKNFAYSSQGLNLTNEGALNYATNWTTQQPCSYADKFIVDFTRIKNFAYSSQGLNMTNENAVNYTKTMVPRICANISFEQIFSKHYNFAYSSQGLNMTTENARRYAQPKAEAEGFVCSIR